MSDILDNTDEVETRLLQLRIQAAQNYSSTLKPIGKCHWCEELFSKETPKLFCDSECAIDHEKHKEFNRGM